MPDANYQFLERLNQYPIVQDTASQLVRSYSYVKTINGLLNKACNLTEAVTGKAATVVTSTVTPLCGDERLKSLDDFACAKLDQIDERLPILSQPSQDVLNTAYQSLCEMTPLSKISQHVPSTASTQALLRNTTDMALAAVNSGLDSAKAVKLILEERVKSLIVLKYFQEAYDKSMGKVIETNYRDIVEKTVQRVYCHLEQTVMSHYKELKSLSGAGLAERLAQISESIRDREIVVNIRAEVLKLYAEAEALVEEVVDKYNEINNEKKELAQAPASQESETTKTETIVGRDEVDDETPEQGTAAADVTGNAFRAMTLVSDSANSLLCAYLAVTAVAQLHCVSEPATVEETAATKEAEGKDNSEDGQEAKEQVEPKAKTAEELEPVSVLNETTNSLAISSCSDNETMEYDQ